MQAMIEAKKITAYKRGRRSFATYWLWTNVFLVAIAVFLYRSNALPAPVWAVLVINLILFISGIATVNLKGIRINEETGSVTILLDRFLFINRTVECAVQDILLTSHVRPSARGMEVQVFGIFVKGDLIIEAIPGLSGWPEHTLQSVRAKIDALQKASLPL